ncbi:MAG: glycosyltransferase family 4 protein [Nitrospinae bacterium]|nr:glycosyltransferase family 4 protein [Nitrospinota bacterium]MBI3813120.1 glycosyltransferase family 4 protein [Nitrospinota bacterium]
MNIGIVTTWCERGAAMVSRAYMKTLSHQHKVFIYARGGGYYAQGNPEWDGEHVTWGKRIPGKKVDWKEFKGWISKNRLDMVIFNEEHDWELVIKTLKTGIIAGAYVDYYKPETIPFFWLYDFLLCNTKRHYSVFKDHPQAFYIPWGTDIDVFKHQDKLNDGVTFFHSAGMSPLRKGTDILVRAFQNVNGKVKLIIHSQGAFIEHPPTASIIAGDPRIELIEKEITAPGLYHLGDIYVYPTRLEGIGLTIAEALASGLPVITTDAQPMNEFVVNELNGRLVKVEKYNTRADNYYWPESICSETGLTEAMQFYVDNISTLGDYKYRARQYAETNLNWEKNSQVLRNLVENISRNPGRSDRRLVKSAAIYEWYKYHRYPKPVEYAIIALQRIGAGWMRRFLKNLLPSKLIGDTK